MAPIRALSSEAKTSTRLWHGWRHYRASRRNAVKTVTLLDACLIFGPVTCTNNFNTGARGIAQVYGRSHCALRVASPAFTARTVAVDLVPAGALLAARQTTFAVAAAACTVDVAGAVFPVGFALPLAGSVLPPAIAERGRAVGVAVGIPGIRAFR